MRQTSSHEFERARLAAEKSRLFSVLSSEFCVLSSVFSVLCSVFSVLCSLFCVLCLAGGGGQRSDLLPAASLMNPHCVYWFDLTLCSVK